jgi:hypothetical protein
MHNRREGRHTLVRQAALTALAEQAATALGDQVCGDRLSHAVAPNWFQPRPSIVQAF